VKEGKRDKIKGEKCEKKEKRNVKTLF